MVLDNCTCEPCSCIEDTGSMCPETFSPNSPVWDGYGLDRYGSSAYGSPTDVLPVVKREVFGLISGYRIRHLNDRSSPYPLSQRVYIYSAAENKAYRKKECTVSYYFTVKSLRMADLHAFIDTKREKEDLYASLFVLTPAFEYGKKLVIELNASDFAGNRMKPFVIEFVIEERN